METFVESRRVTEDGDLLTGDEEQALLRAAFEVKKWSDRLPVDPWWIP